MSKESKDKVSKLPFSFKAEAGQQADVAVRMASPVIEVSVIHNIDINSEAHRQALEANSQPPSVKQQASALTAQDILLKSEAELKELMPERTRETHNLLKSMKILTAIMLGKDKNKELAQMLQTDKSFTSKQIKELEEQGLVKREGEGRETKYIVDAFNLMKFLQTKVIIKWGKKEEGSNAQPKAAPGRGQELPKTGGGQSPPAVR